MKIVEDNFVKENPEYYVMVCDHCGSKILVNDNELHEDDHPFNLAHFRCPACCYTAHVGLFGYIAGSIRYHRYKKKGLV